jgi:hypothetical protein
MLGQGEGAAIMPITSIAARVIPKSSATNVEATRFYP